MRHRIPRQGSIVAVGSVLPSLVVVDQSQHAVDLRSVATGRRKVIVFYSPSCEVCQKELPELTPFPRELALVKVKEGSAATADPFAMDDTLTDRDGVLRRAFVMPSLPTMLFVDEKGFVRGGLIGAHAPADVHQKLVAFAHARS